MADDTVIAATRADIDDVVFASATEIADTMHGMSVREKTKFAISVADRIMEGIDNLGGKAARSEAAKKAAAARYAKPKSPAATNVPTPGPAIPPPVPQTPVVPVAADAIPANMLPPPPHPALIPQNAPGATPMPFGAPPA